MKNSLSSPKKVSVFHRYAPLLKGGLMKTSMLAFIILLCSFTLFRFFSAQFQFLVDNGIVGKEIAETISICLGGFVAALSITHFSAMLPVVIRDLITLLKWKKAEDNEENKPLNERNSLAKENVRIPVLLANLLVIGLILGADGYISTTGVQNVVKNYGNDLALDKYTVGNVDAESTHSAESATIWQSWRTDSSNIAKKYQAQIDDHAGSANKTANELRNKAKRGEAQGSTVWAASLRVDASKAESALQSKINKIEVQRAQDLLDRSKLRDEDLRTKSGERQGKIASYAGEKAQTENKFGEYASMTWVLSLGLYLVYIGTCITQEFIHDSAGVENKVEVQESYFRVPFTENLRHELGEWSHDCGRLITNKLKEWRKGLHSKEIFKNIPFDAGDVYKQEVDYTSAVVMNQVAEEGREPDSYVEEPYKQTGKIGFPPLTPPPLAQSTQERILPDGRIELTTNFDTVPPFVKVFEDRVGAEAWKRHIHPAVPMREKVLSSSLQRELAQMKTSPQAPPPPPPPKITEVAAPCENVITNSDLRARKATVITEKETVITENEPVITAEMLKNIPEAVLLLAVSGASKLASEANSRKKTGEIRPQTYEKKMRRVSEGKRLITKALGQGEFEFL